MSIIRRPGYLPQATTRPVVVSNDSENISIKRNGCTYVASHSIGDIQHKLADILVLTEDRIIKYSTCRRDILAFRFLDFLPQLGLRSSWAQTIVALK